MRYKLFATGSNQAASFGILPVDLPGADNRQAMDMNVRDKAPQSVMRLFRKIRRREREMDNYLWYEEEDKEIRARCEHWRDDLPISYVVARDCNREYAQLFIKAPVLLKALEAIDLLAIDRGLDITAPESPERDLVYRIHTVAIQAIQDVVRPVRK